MEICSGPVWRPPTTWMNRSHMRTHGSAWRTRAIPSTSYRSRIAWSPLRAHDSTVKVIPSSVWPDAADDVQVAASMGWGRCRDRG